MVPYLVSYMYRIWCHLRKCHIRDKLPSRVSGWCMMSSLATALLAEIKITDLAPPDMFGRYDALAFAVITRVAPAKLQ